MENTALQKNMDFILLLLKVLKKHFKAIILVSILSFATAYVIVRLSPRSYNVSSTLLVNEEEKGSLDKIFGSETLSMNSSQVENEIILLKSKKIISKAIKTAQANTIYYYENNLGLVRQCKTSPFRVAIAYDKPQLQELKIKIEIQDQDRFILSYEAENASVGYIDSTKSISISNTFSQSLRFGEKLESPYLSCTIYKKNAAQLSTGTYYISFTPTAKLVYQVQAKLAVLRYSNKSSVIKIVLSYFNTEQAIALVNAITKNYVHYDVENKKDQFKRKIAFIDNRINEIVTDLQSSELRLEKFQSNNKSINIDYTSKKMYDLMIDKQTEKEIHQIKLSYYEYLKEYVNTNPSEELVIPSFEGTQDEILNKQVLSLTEANLQLKEAEAKYSKTNPIYIDLKQKVSNISKSIDRILTKYIATTELRIKEITTSIQKVESKVRQLPKFQRELLNIKRKFDVNNGVYTFLLERRAEANIQMAATFSNKEVIDPASLDSRLYVKPNKKLIFGLCMVVGLSALFVFIFFKTILNPTVQSAKEVKDISTHIPFLGEIPKCEKEDLIQGTEWINPKSMLFESLRLIRQNLNFMLIEDKKTLLGVTSYMPKDGKSFISKNIALAYALYDKKTLWVNCDLRKIQENGTAKTGLSNYLSKQCSLEDIIQQDETGLYTIENGPLPPNPSELLESDGMSRFLEIIKNDYDIVFLDFPPAALISDWKTLNRKLDRTLYIVRHEHSHISSLDMLKNMDHYNVCSVYNYAETPISKAYGYYNYKKN